MKNRKKLISISGILIILLLIILTSYGYITTTILGNSASKRNIFRSNPFTIAYSDNTNIIAGDASDSFSPGSTITKTFSITNTANATFSYSIILDDITNTFTRTSDITYTISLNGTELKTDTFPTTKETIIYSQSIEPNETLSYTLTINYYNDPEENQIVDSGASIGAKLTFDYSDGFYNILIYGNSVLSRLPDGYTELEYIESTGTQYIDTGVHPKSTTKVIFDFAFSDASTPGYNGWGSSGGQEAFMWGGRQNGYFTSFVSTSWKRVDSSIPLDTNRHVFILESGDQQIDGISYGSTQIGNTATTGQNIWLFGLHEEWSSSGTLVNEKVYSCKIYDSNTLVRDFIPAKDSNNVVGLYDTVTKNFFENQGTGTFIEGPTIATLIETEESSVGDKTTNLFDINSSLNSQLVANGNGTYTIWKNSNGRFSEYVPVSIPANTPIYVSADILDDNVTSKYALQFEAKYSDNTSNNGTWVNKTVTFPKDVIAIRIYQDGSNEIGTYTTFKNFQIVYGSSVLDYEPYGYKLPITIGNSTIYIYLTEPLRKVGNYVDYIDFKRKKLVRNIEYNNGVLSGLLTPTEESIDVPDLSTIKYFDNISVGTSLQPSSIVYNHG